MKPAGPRGGFTILEWIILLLIALILGFIAIAEAAMAISYKPPGLTARVRLEELRDRLDAAKKKTDGGKSPDIQAVFSEGKDHFELWRQTNISPFSRFYMVEVPHPPTLSLTRYASTASRDTGGFGYVAGWRAGVVRIFIDCTHTDDRGTPWTAY